MCIDLHRLRLDATPWSRSAENNDAGVETPDDEPSPLLRRLGGNGLAHLRSRVGQRPRSAWPELSDLRVGPGRSPRMELPVELAQPLVRRAQRAELEYMIRFIHFA